RCNVFPSCGPVRHVGPTAPRSGKRRVSTLLHAGFAAAASSGRGRDMLESRSIRTVLPSPDKPARRNARAIGWAFALWIGVASAASSVPTDSLFFDPFEGALQSIDVACGDSVLAGEPVSCIATGTFASGAQIDITGDVDWSSSDETIAIVVDAGGDLLTANPGQSTITATRGLVHGMTTLNVTLLLVQSTQPADGATGVS